MESRIAKEAERALIEATQRLSPEERLNAHLEHCRLVMELYEAGQRMPCAVFACAGIPSGLLDPTCLMLDADIIQLHRQATPRATGCEIS
jgi:hypothetical protein